MNSIIAHAGRYLAMQVSRHPKETAEAIGTAILTAAPYVLPAIAIIAVGIGVARLASDDSE